MPKKKDLHFNSFLNNPDWLLVYLRVGRKLQYVSLKRASRNYNLLKMVDDSLEKYRYTWRRNRKINTVSGTL